MQTNWQPPPIQVRILHISYQFASLLVIINYNFASVWFSTRLLISPILRLVHKLYPLPTIFLLPLYVIKLIVGCGIGSSTSSVYNAMVLLFMWCCCHRSYIDFRIRQKSVKSVESIDIINKLYLYICLFYLLNCFFFIHYINMKGFYLS